MQWAKDAMKGSVVCGKCAGKGATVVWHSHASTCSLRWLQTCSEKGTGDGSYFDGWSSFSGLRKRDPGLVETNGRPMQCYLTPEVYHSPKLPCSMCCWYSWVEIDLHAAAFG